MKKQMLSMKLLVIAAVVGLSLGACQKDEVIAETSPTVESQKMRQHLVEVMGFHDQNIVELEDEFIVEGDILFKKEGFWNQYGSSEDGSSGKNYRSQYLVNPTKNLKVYIEPDVPSRWVNALLEAMTAWNNLGGRNTFSRTLFDTNDDIWVQLGCYPSEPSGIAFSISPNSYHKAGYFIVINSCSNYYGNQLASYQKKYCMMHELGHTIGLRHTNVSGPDSYAITTTSSSCNSSFYNTNSVMSTNTVLNNGFTSCDILAINALYPL